MRISLMIEGQEGVGWATWLSLAGLAEDLGFDSLIRSDHVLSMFEPEGRGSMDAWTTIAGLAAVTNRIGLGTLVSPIGFRHPALLARMVASADVVSEGRVEVGIGAGWYEREHRAFGYRFEDGVTRFDRLCEYVEVVHTLLGAEGAVDFAGDHYTLEGARLMPKPHRRPRPPILMGGLARPRAATLAARFADGYNFYETTPAGVRPKRSRLEAACERIDRDPGSLELSVNANVLVGRNHDDLRWRAQRHAAYRGVDEYPDDYLASLDPSVLIGTPDEILERLAAYAAAGIGRIMMQVFPHDDEEAITIIGEQVVGPAASLRTSR